MEAIQMITNLSEYMRSWREGLLSDGEMLAYLLCAVNEVHQSISVKEEAIAEKGIACIYGKAE